MENTGKVHFEFEDQTPHWYVALGDRWIGPMSAADVYSRVTSGEITWAHFVWKPGQVDWKRICDTKTFQSAVPSAPAKGMQSEVKEASRPMVRSQAAKTPPKPRRGTGEIEAPTEAKEWFLYYNESQYGPFTDGDVHRFLKAGKIHGRVHIWKDGMSGWERIERLPSFEESVAASKKARETKKSSGTKTSSSQGRAKAEAKNDRQSEKDQRIATRKPLVAKILMANHDSLSAAVCRDISVGGMQVLTDRIPGAPGTRIKMNVSPSGPQGSGGKIAPFVAEGVIVRILEDGHGFSFRFDKLSDSAKRVIEGYIQQNEG